MLLGINEQNEIIVVNEIPDGLNVVEVDETIFGDKEPTQFKIRTGENWYEITPRYPTQGL